MLVNVKLRQRTDIDLEFIFIRQMFRKLRVQTMNSFYNKYIIISKLLCLLSIFLMTGDKVKRRDHNFFSIQKLLKLTVKQFSVHCLQAFIIVISVLVLRIIFSLYEIIIYSDRMRHQTVGTKLDRQSMGKCCLPGRGRSCDQDKFNLWIRCDRCRDLGNLLLLKRFLHKHRLHHIPFCDLIIERAYRFDSLHISPFCRLLKHLKELILRFKRRYYFRCRAFRHLNHKSIVVFV